MNTMVNNRLRPSGKYKFFLKGDNEGFIEGLERTYKMKGDHVSIVVEIIHRLNHEPIDQLLGSLPSEKRSKVEDSINILIENKFLVKESVHTIFLYTSEKFGEFIHTHLMDSLEGIANVEKIDSLEKDVQNVDSHHMVVAVTDSSQDPKIFELNEWCVNNRVPVLFAGFDVENTAFIGPYWGNGETNACYQCFQDRINMNSLYGETRKEFEGHLKNDPTVKSFSKLRSMKLFSTFLNELSTSLVDILDSIDRFEDRINWLKDNGGKIESKEHPLLPVPYCSVCHEFQMEEINVKTYQNNLFKAVDEKQGIVHMISEIPGHENDSSIHVVGSKSSNLSLYHPSLKIITNAGAGAGLEEASHSAIGESLERYAANIYNDEDLVHSSWTDLRDSAIHPSQFALFSAEQYREPDFPYVPFEEESQIRWVRGNEIGGAGKQKMIPACAVYLPYRYKKDEIKVMPSISTGLAAGKSIRAAILTGLYEVLERDAFTVSWINRIPPREVKDELTEEMKRRYFKQNLDFSIYDLTLDIEVPVSFVVMKNRNYSEEIVNVGGACRRNSLQSIDKAMLEAAQGSTYVSELMELYKDWNVDDKFTDVNSFQKHALFYSKFPHMIKKADYLLDGAKEFRSPLQNESGTEMDDDLDWVVERVRSAGYTPYFVDLTTPDLRKIGVYVVRVVVPGLQHLHGHHRYSFLGGKRLQKIPEKMNMNVESLNVYPHPYP
jgi:ribosomal protein S12 methylthiotransferase accessory factor